MVENTYSKIEFADYVATKTGQGKAYTQKMVESIFEAIVILVGEKKKEINIPGFGKISAIPTAARTGRNPKSGESIHISASHKIKFKPAKNFKDVVKA